MQDRQWVRGEGSQQMSKWITYRFTQLWYFKEVIALLCFQVEITQRTVAELILELYNISEWQWYIQETY